MPLLHDLRVKLLQSVYQIHPFNLKGDLQTKLMPEKKGVISCIIPTNRPEHLKELTDDIAKQDIDQTLIETIVINSAKEKSSCLGYLRNLGIAQSQGELLLFLDDDTRIFQQNFLSKALNIFQREGFDILAPKGNALYSFLKPRNSFLKPFSFATRCCFLKRKTVLEVNGFRHLYSFEDTEMRIRIQINKRKVTLSDQLQYLHPPSDLSCKQKPYALAASVINLRKYYPFYFWLLIYLNQFFLIFERHRFQEVLWLILGLFVKKDASYLSTHANKNKIILIGPSFPLRGGIAHHSSCLYEALKQKHELTFYSFHKLYPRWLFPGKSIEDSSQEISENKSILRILSGSNPLNWIKTALRIRKEAPKQIILAWWTIFLAPAYVTILCFIKDKNTKITIICHNALPHELTPLSKLLTQLVLSQANEIIVHARSEKEKLKSFLQHPQITQTFMPPDTYYTQDKITQEKARQILKLRGKVILFFGLIRPYKGLSYLLKAMPLVLQETEATLIIAGECWEDPNIYKEMISAFKINHAVHFINKYIPSNEVALYFQSADIVACPYLSASGSGVLEIAQGFNKPVIATRTGSFNDMIEDNKNGYLVEAANETQLATALIKGLNSLFIKDASSYIQENNKKYSWANLADILTR